MRALSSKLIAVSGWVVAAGALLSLSIVCSLGNMGGDFQRTSRSAEIPGLPVEARPSSGAVLVSMPAAGAETASAPAKAQGPLVTEHLCSASGALATSYCEAAHTSYEVAMPSSQLPRQACTKHLVPMPASVLAQDTAFLQATPGTPVTVLRATPVQKSEVVREAPATEVAVNEGAYLSPASTQPPLILNGTRYAAATPLFPESRGGAHPLPGANGVSRTPRISDAYRDEDGIRVLRAEPASGRPAYERAALVDDDGDNDRPARRGFFHRLFSGRR